MENTGSTTTIIKGSTSPAGEVIAVDPEALCCPRCLQLLVPPVLQCVAGHLICSSCHDNLSDKTKCVSCFTLVKSYTATSYSRCHAVEGILRSVRLVCPNTIYGCTAGKMLYHEKMEHEKVCPSKASSRGIAGRVVKMGPYGSDGGKAFDIDVCRVGRIIKIVVWHRAALPVDAMSVLYEQDGREKETNPVWGVPDGGVSEFCLESDEYLTALKGHVGNYETRKYIVTSLTFVSNRRTYGPYGKEKGEQFELLAAGGQIVGFHRRSSSYLDALGTYAKMAV